MHHMYPLAKGDPLCPLGFHPQVRWPTRCKRCFRDYKEHGGKKRDEPALRRDNSTASTPSLSLNSNDGNNRRSWMSSTNLTSENGNQKSANNNEYSNPSSWTSTPDLANLQDDVQAVTTVSIKLPKRRQKLIETGHRTVSDSFSIIRDKNNKKSLYDKEDSLATRAKKLQEIQETRGSQRIQVQEVKSVSQEPNNHDVKRNLKAQKSVDVDGSGSENEDTISNAGTETTDTTLVGADNEMMEQLESLKKELDATKAKCERLEREKSDILLRRLAAMETTTSKTTASEVLKLQQKCNDLQQQLEDYRDEKRSLTLRVKELEVDLDLRPTAQEAQKTVDELRSKLLAAETLCEELMDENEDIKKELRDMEEQIDEMQDNFREDQAVEYTSIKKELDQTTKNCRILSFKLRKTERKAEQLETEKAELEKKLNQVSDASSVLSHVERIKQLEQELKVSNEVSLRLQKELEESNRIVEERQISSMGVKKKAPLLEKMSRESLTRGGSQEDPAQLLRDLQDSLEREADLREQLKFAEEEAENLRKKVSRIEDDNESLVLQVKKMASRARGRKHSPTSQRLSPDGAASKNDVTEEEDPNELKLQLELSEQESSVLRKKIEELEGENRKLKAKTKDIHDKLTSKQMRRSLINSEKDDGNRSGALDGQKIKVLEDETNELRKKLIEKERDCERLHAELSLNSKRSKGVQKSKSLDLDQQTLDLKRQLQSMEQETSVLRNKVQSLESENDKLNGENKRLALLAGTKSKKMDKNVDKYIDQIATLEVELEGARKTIEQLTTAATGVNGDSSSLFAETRKGDYRKFSQRAPKKVSALTTREQLKNMVGDLEKEIGEMLTCLKTSENERTKLEREMKKTVKLELEGEREKQIEVEVERLNKSLEKVNGEKNELKEEVASLKEEKNQISVEKAALEAEISKLKSDWKSLETKKEEIIKLTSELDILKSNVDSKTDEIKNLKMELRESKKFAADNAAKAKKIAELQSELITKENNYSECEKKCKSFEAKIENEKRKIKTLESEQVKWEKEKKKFILQIEEFNSNIKSLENAIEDKDRSIKQLEECALKAAADGKEIAKKNQRLTELESKLDAAVKNQRSLEDKLKKGEAERKNAKVVHEKRVKELEIDLTNEKKKVEVLKSNADKEHKNREMTSRYGTKKEADDVNYFRDSIDKLERSVAEEKQKYNDLTAKYEILEEEHVVTKAKLVMENETLNHQYNSLRKECEQLEGELKTLRETYNTKQDAWIKDRLELEQRIKELSNRQYSTVASNGNDYEKQRLKAVLGEKQSEIDNVRKEHDAIQSQMEYMRRENDELKKKLDDYEKVNKIQRTISADSSAMDKEMKQLRLKLSNFDKSKKSELAECKIRYESQLNVVNAELRSLQNQVLRFKREKDSYKHMLESAQKTIGELKQSPHLNKSKDPKERLYYDELEDAKTKVLCLEQQVSCMEDELSEARLESSRLKTEMVSEKSTWEVKLSELHSKINELEEEKVLSSGRTKIMGLRTRMELAWQKEREEQQRLLQETATLARDLRQTLFEVERERDKERLEAKRKQEQFKKSVEEEQEETKRKVTELQCDLLELRDAHAKLRTTNEKLRREKERYERDREEYRVLKMDRRKVDLEDDRKVNAIIEQVDMLKQLAPELFFCRDDEAPYTPTPPRRTKSKSRETSPALDRTERSLSVDPEEKKQKIQLVMQRLVHTTEDLRKLQRVTEDDDEKERMRRMGMRRATSTETESRYNRNMVRKASVTSQGSLYRKSLSLEHTTGADQKIWTNEVNVNDSLSSLRSMEEAKRDFSLDSRLSGGSTQSDVGDKKKKKSLMGKLRNLTKSRSIDDQDPGSFSPTRALSSSKNNSGSDILEDRGSKKDLKDRITGIFKRSGSSSRSNSVERKHETSSTQRPLVRNSATGGSHPSGAS
ncbi:uncharacterized protein LOC132708624 isoform X2 [Cylas formicarius]|uniref:uncharacterized protein LOC132708624 isoform X2 n=1 Tax=Cylas formicarius TaxID=197179 RepID=UPI0029585925|nr:uncharacterized protein LOC132708624 isoform X2 [Cylas formicarius]